MIGRKIRVTLWFGLLVSEDEVSRRILLGVEKVWSFDVYKMLAIGDIT